MVVDTATAEPADTCSAVPDPVWVSFVTGLDATTQQGFLCAYGPAVAVNGERLDFEQGFMLRLDNHPADVYIYYNGESRWEMIRDAGTPDDPGTQPDIVPGPDFYLPTGVFAYVWADEQIRVRLGFALAPQAESFPGKLQTFPGGTLVYNFSNSKVRAFFVAR
jgi:hypothetical protein